jgi:hypothetical protein
MRTKAQTYLIYAGVVAIVATTLIIISGYIMQKVQGSYKQAGDSLGLGELKD